MNHLELATEITKISKLTGHFLLRSGQTSSEYFDKYRFESEPKLLREIAKQLAPMVPVGTEILAGLELGGVPLATALSLETGIPMLFVRKKAKDYGTCQFAEGREFRGKKVCIIEDVVTTGGQVLLSSKDLREAGAIIEDVICVILRGQNVDELKAAKLNIKALFTKEQLDQSIK